MPDEVVEQLNEERVETVDSGPSNADLGHALIGLMYQLSLIAERVSAIEQFLAGEPEEEAKDEQ